MDDDLDDDWEYGQDQWEPFNPDPHFHGTLTPIRRRGRPYANEPGSPWMSPWTNGQWQWDASIDLTKAQTERLMAMLTTPSARPIVMGSQEPLRVFHEPENP